MIESISDLANIVGFEGYVGYMDPTNKSFKTTYVYFQTR